MRNRGRALLRLPACGLMAVKWRRLWKLKRVVAVPTAAASAGPACHVCVIPTGVRVLDCFFPACSSAHHPHLAHLPDLSACSQHQGSGSRGCVRSRPPSSERDCSESKKSLSASQAFISPPRPASHGGAVACNGGGGGGGGDGGSVGGSGGGWQPKGVCGGGAPARLAAPPQCPRTTTIVAGRVGLPTAVDRPQGLRCLRRGAATAAWRPSQRLWRLTWAPQPTSLAAAVAAAGAAGLGTGGMPVAHAGWTRGAAGRGTELQLGKPWRCEERSATQKGAPAAQKGTPVEGAPTSRLSPLTPPDGMEEGDDGAAAGRRRPRW